MRTPRALKQLFVFTFYFVIFAVLAGGFWYLFFYNKPIKEVCGNKVCGKNESFSNCPFDCEAPVTWKDIEVVKVSVIPTGANFYDVAVLINNPNSAGGIKDLSYRMNLLGDGNADIGFREGRTFILPGDSKYIFEINIESLQPIRGAQISFGPQNWQKLKSDVKNPEIRVKNTVFSLRTESNEYRLIGLTQNLSNFDFREVFLETILFDDSGNIIGVNSTVQGALKAGEEREFEFFWSSDEVKGTVKSQSVKAEVNVFDSETFMKRYGEAQPLY